MLSANLTAGFDEARSDTGRIQAAIDNCARGQAVELNASGTNNIFLSGALELRAGVTLLVDRGVILYASRNPRDYGRQQRVCGTITEKGHGCRALINGDNVADAGVMETAPSTGAAVRKSWGRRFRVGIWRSRRGREATKTIRVC